MADKTSDTNKPADSENSVAHFVDFFKHLVGFDLNAIISMATPESTKAAQALAESVKKRFPEEHWLRSTLAYRAVGLLASRVESAGEGQPKSIKAVLEKFSDFIEEFGQSLWKDSSHIKNGKASPKPDASKNSVDFAELKKRLALEAFELSRMAKPGAGMTAVQEQVKERLCFLSELEALMAEGPKEKETQKPKPTTGLEIIPWTRKVETGWEKFWKWAGKWWKEDTESLQSGNERLTVRIEQLETENQRRKANKAFREPSVADRILLWPWKFLLGLFGLGSKSQKTDWIGPTFWGLAAMGTILICSAGHIIQKLRESWWMTPGLWPIPDTKTTLTVIGISILVAIGCWKLLRRFFSKKRNRRQTTKTQQPQEEGVIDL